ncbi:MAG: VWA domain-containing protein [Pirellulales bacterium]|nr:VWA domain-containing protein [Pirellulales bacterium]
MQPAAFIPVFAQASPWMFGWLAAAAAPILIHLWSRQKYREMSWAAMEYLLAAVRRSRRRVRLEQWLLLAIRTLLIILVVLAVVQSLLQHVGFTPTTSGRTHRVLVVDASYSMGYKPEEKSRFDQARQLARQIVEGGRQGDACTLVVMASPPRVVVGKPALDADELLEEIDQLRLGHTSANLPATVELVGQVVQAARREDSHLDRHEVYFLTDLGRIGWRPLLDGPAAAAFQKRSRDLAQAAALMVIDVGQPAAENIAVTDLRSLDPLPTPGRRIGLEATLENFGRQPQTGQTVELLVDGRSVDQQRVELQPGGRASVSFLCRFDMPGDHAVEVRAAGDALDVDNHRWMAAPVRRSIRVLCIDGRPSGEPFRGATDWLVYALNPQDRRDEQAPIGAEAAPESALLERDLGRYDCVFLCSVAQFTAHEAAVLRGYLDHGGNLVLFLGEGVLADRYNRELGDGAGQGLLLPARLGPTVDASPGRLDPLGYRHPIVEPFRGREQAGLLTTPVEKYCKLHVPDGSKAQVVLATAAGDPLVVEHTAGRGRVVLVATSADTSWTLMPVWPSFVPVVQELLAYCVGGAFQQRNVEVGQPLETSIVTPAADVAATLRAPGEASRQVPLRTDGDYATFHYDETVASGIYTAEFGPPIDQQRRFAANVDTVESDLTQLSEDQLRHEVWPGVAFQHRTSWQSADGGMTAPILRPPRLHLDLLYLALAMLFMETFLAWRFGHHTT